METILIRPSSILPEGICVQKVDNLTLFKFTEPLGNRLQELLDKKKANTLEPDEVLELETIGELDNIFSYINAVMARCLELWLITLEKELLIAVSIVTIQKFSAPRLYPSIT
jgi:hypothetical protein